jgi:hypothetical protein
VDTVRGPTTANVELESKAVEVILDRTGTFDNSIGLNYDDLTLSNREWGTLELQLHNPLARFLVVPVEPQFPIGTHAEPGSMTLLLGPLERKKVSFSVFPDYNMRPNQYLEGNYSVMSLAPDVNARLRVNPGTLDLNATGLQITDLTPIFQNGKLQLEISVQNRGAKATSLTVASPVAQQVFSVGPRQSRLIEFITDASPPSVSIRLESGDFNQTLEIHIPKIRPPDQPVAFPRPDQNREQIVPVETGSPADEGPTQVPVNYLNSPLTVALLGGAIIICALLADELFGKK